MYRYTYIHTYIYLSIGDHEVIVGLAGLHCGTFMAMLRGQHVTVVAGGVLFRMEVFFFFFYGEDSLKIIVVQVLSKLLPGLNVSEALSDYFKIIHQSDSLV